MRRVRGRGEYLPIRAWRRGQSRPIASGKDGSRLDQSSPGHAAEIADRFRKLTVWLILASAALAFSLWTVLRVDVDPQGTYVFDWLLAALLLVSRMWWQRTRHERISDTLGTTAAATLGGMACGATAMFGLRLHFPLVDTQLRTLDHIINADGISIVESLVTLGDGLFAVTLTAYNFALPLFFGSLLILSVTGERVEAWRAAMCFVGTLLTTCIIASFVPAKGLGIWGTTSLFAKLPDSAMRGFWAHFDEFYYGAHPVLRLRAVDGVISFPSFHAAVGFLVIAMWRKNQVTLAAATVWFLCMLPGTLLYGGHYVVDLVAGFAVWAAWFAGSRRLEQFARKVAPVT